MRCSFPPKQFLYRCILAFPEDYKTLVPKLLIETMSSICTSFVSRVNLATGNVVPETKALAKGYSSNFFSCFQFLFCALDFNNWSFVCPCVVFHLE